MNADINTVKDDDDFSSLPVDPLYEKEKNPMKQSQILTPQRVQGPPPTNKQKRTFPKIGTRKVTHSSNTATFMSGHP